MSDKNNFQYSIGLNSYDGDEPYLFVSYSHADTKEVADVLKIVDKEKFRFWYDDTMEIGEDFREELRARIENCHGVLLFVSPASMRSKYCGMEIISAYKYNKKIYPIYLEDDVDIPAPLKMILENLQHVKGIKNHTSEKYIYKLISGLPIETMRSLQIDDGVLLRCKDGSTSLGVPSGVNTIGESAFKNCEKLEEIDLGAEVEIIQKEAFRGCKSLQSLNLPKNVRKVGESCFRDCISLTSLSVECEDLELGERAFENCAKLSDVSLQDGMTEIYGGVFNSCKMLAKIKLPKMLTILGESSFADCARLKSIDIPENVTKIDDMVFNGCIELEEINMKNNLTKIGKNAFKDCKSLRSITLPSSLTAIGAGPFRGCCNLNEIKVDPKNKFFKSLDSVLFNKNKSSLICYPSQTGDKSYTIPDSVTIISDWAFCECAKLEKIIIPDSVNEIGEGAFYSCTAVKELVLPDSVTRIDDIAFRGCTALKRITIPDSVKEFGWGVFNGCDDVTVVCNPDSTAAKYCAIKNIPTAPLK